MPIRFLDEPQKKVESAIEGGLRIPEELRKKTGTVGEREGKITYLAPVGAPAPVPSQTTPRQFFEQGALVEGPANLAGLADLAINTIDPQRRGIAGGPPLKAPSDFGGAVREAMAARLGAARGRPIEPPQTGVEKLSQAAGAGIVETLPLSLLGGGATRPGLVAADLASGATGEMGRQMAEAGGAETAGQILFSLAGGLGPRTVLSASHRVARSAARLIPGMNVRAAENLAHQAFWADLNAADKTQRARALYLLDQEINKPFGWRTTEQILGDEFPVVSGRMAGAAKSGGVSGSTKLRGQNFPVDMSVPAYRKRIEDLREYNARATLDFGNQAFPVGHSTAATQRWQSELAQIRAQVKAAYDGIGDIQGLSTDKLDAAALWVTGHAGAEKANLLPKRQLRMIESYHPVDPDGNPLPPEVSFKQLQRLQSSIKNDIRIARRSGDRERAFYLTKLSDGVEATFADVAAAGGSSEVNALRRARDLRHMEGQLFNPKDPLNKVLGGESEDIGAAFTAYMNTAPRPATDLKRLEATIGQDPQAWAGVKRLVRDHVFGDNFSVMFGTEPGSTELVRSGTNAVIKNITKYREVIDTVYGPGSADNAMDFARRARDLATGESAKIQRFGAVRLDEPSDAAQAGTVAEIATWNPVRAGIRAAALAYGRLPDTQEEANMILGLAAFNPEIAKGFLERLPAREAMAWKTKVTRALALEGVRGAAGTEMGEGRGK